MSAEGQRSLLEALVGDGRPLLMLTGTALFFSGGFAILQSLSGHLLPHDSEAIGMDAAMLSHVGNQHLTHFMFHDRVAYGGTLLAVGTGYWWLSEFPLRSGKAWAWWAYAISGVTGFVSFLAYLGYGYLDTWHAVATIFLLPTFLVGLWLSRSCFGERLRFKQIWQAADGVTEGAAARGGRRLLGACAAGMILAGITIVIVGMTVVFVPQDIKFMNLTSAQLTSISPVLVPLIAHDRAGFGGGLVSAGLLIGMMTRHAPLTRSFVEVIGVMGFFGFGAALGVHAAIGYLDFTHLAPAYAGVLLFLVGLTLCTIAVSQKTNTTNDVEKRYSV